MTPGRDPGDRLGVRLAAIVTAAGVALLVMEAIPHKGYVQAVSGLVPGLPLLAVGLVIVLAVRRRDVDIAVWLALLVAVGLTANLVLYWAKAGNEVWSWLIPTGAGWGVDFRDGLYDPARAFSVAHSGWPPLTLYLGSAFTLLPFSAAYAVQIGLLFGAAAVAAALSAALAVRVVAHPDHGAAGGPVAGGAPATDEEPGRVGAAGLGLVFGVWLLTSYGFLYEVQRGNVDLYALVFCLLTVWLTLRLPRSPWWPALALAVAVNLKLYPVILCVLVFWRYRLKALVPVLVTNAALLLVAGPANTWRLMAWLADETPEKRPAVWTDMGAAGTASVMRVLHPSLTAWLLVPLVLTPLALWAATGVLLVRQGWSPARAVLLAAACVLPMAVVPTISNDYKLVLLVFPLAVVAAALGGMAVPRAKLDWCLSFGTLGWLILMLGRTTLAHGAGLLGGKYSLAVVLQALLLYVVWRLRREESSERVTAREARGERPAQAVGDVSVARERTERGRA